MAFVDAREFFLTDTVLMKQIKDSVPGLPEWAGDLFSMFVNEIDEVIDIEEKALRFVQAVDCAELVAHSIFSEVGPDAFLDVISALIPHTDSMQLISNLAFVVMFWDGHDNISGNSISLVNFAIALGRLSKISSKEVGIDFVVPY